MNGIFKSAFCVLFSWLFFLPLYLYGQNNAPRVVLHFHPILNGNPAEDGIISGKISGDSMAILTLRFYLGNFVFYKNGKETGQDNSGYHLLDMEDENSLSIVLKPSNGVNFDAIRFTLGTDSLTNVSGVIGGDLDPTKGMYWAWNSGYINLKIEGYAAKCPTRNHQFQFHIGGYMPPFKTVQMIELTGLKQLEIVVDMELSVFFENVDLGEAHNIMSPSEAAVQLAKLMPKTFRIHGE